VSLAEIAQLFWQYGVACLALGPFAFGALILMRRVMLRGVQPKPATLVVPLWRKALSGLGLAAAALVPCIAIPAALGLYNPAHSGWVAYNAGDAPAGLSGGLACGGLFVVQSLAEELLFRAIVQALLGVLFYWQTVVVMAPALYRRDPAQPAAARWFRLVWLGSGIAAAAVVSIAFGMVHAHNPSFTHLSLVNITLAGFALGMLFWVQGDVSGAWAMHWLWNTLQALVGLPVSGNVLCGPALGFGALGAAPGVLTGGGFGPEGSVLSLLTLALASVWIVWQGCRGVGRAGGANTCAIR
jgi:membrane protease YdiL (CAAX protease family)